MHAEKAFNDLLTEMLGYLDARVVTDFARDYGFRPAFAVELFYNGEWFRSARPLPREDRMTMALCEETVTKLRKWLVGAVERNDTAGGVRGAEVLEGNEIGGESI